MKSEKKIKKENPGMKATIEARDRRLFRDTASGANLLHHAHAAQRTTFNSGGRARAGTH